jgi:hypothetical protein
MPVRTAGATAIWDGTEVLFLAGSTPTQSPPAGVGAYNPATNTWRQLPAMPFSRADFAAVWTGSQMIVWGGYATGGELHRRSGLHARHSVTGPPGGSGGHAKNTWSSNEICRTA